MNLCIKHWQYTSGRIDSLSLQGLPALFASLRRALTPFCAAVVNSAVKGLEDVFRSQGQHHKSGTDCLIYRD